MLPRLMLLTILILAPSASTTESPEGGKSTDSLRSLAPSQPKSVRLDELRRIIALSEEETIDVGPEAAELLKAACDDPDVEIRRTAVIAFGEVCVAQLEQCPPVLIERLLDSDADVRFAAGGYARHFEEFPTSAVPRLIAAMDHSDHCVRSDAALMLGKSKPRDRKISTEITRVLERATHDPHLEVVHNAHIALSQATNDLKPLICYAVRGVEEHARHVRHGDTEDLSEEEVTQSQLRWVLSLGCATILHREAKERPREVAEIIIPMLKDPSPVVRRSAARNLGAVSTASMKAKRTLRAMDLESKLQPLLDDPDPSVRRNAAYGLSLLREKVSRDLQNEPAVAEDPTAPLPEP